MYYIYLIKSVHFPDQTSIGFTQNINERLETHNSGGSIHTEKYRPWKLIVFFAFNSEYKALTFEKYLKSGSGRAFAKKRFW